MGADVATGLEAPVGAGRADWRRELGSALGALLLWPIWTASLNVVLLLIMASVWLAFSALGVQVFLGVGLGVLNAALQGALPWVMREWRRLSFWTWLWGVVLAAYSVVYRTLIVAGVVAAPAFKPSRLFAQSPGPVYALALALLFLASVILFGWLAQRNGEPAISLKGR